MRDWDQAAAQALKSEQASSTSEAVQWCLMMFPLWDAIPAESIIKHPRLVWDQLYVSVITGHPICSRSSTFDSAYIAVCLSTYTCLFQ
eukprot:5817645-Pleurochrysis_carterae.AAC.1